MQRNKRGSAAKLSFERNKNVIGTLRKRMVTRQVSGIKILGKRVWSFETMDSARVCAVVDDISRASCTYAMRPQKT